MKAAEKNKNMEYEILEAAEKLFLEQGYAKTTTGQIAKLAGCNQALVHYYYRTKDNLFNKIFEEKIQFMGTNFLSINSTGITLEEKISRMIETHFDFLRANPRLVPFIVTEILSDFDKFKYLIDKLKMYQITVFTQLEVELKKASDEGKIRPISAADLMFTIVSLNVTTFLLQPIALQALNLSEEEFQYFVEHRKQEVMTTVMARLKK